MSSESLSLLEEFYAWKLCGPANYADLPARTVDALFVLEKEFIGEKKDG
ncbi:MAG TPA: hypothetical protein VMZ52_03510 [Bryobacteraceae bacterium]|nr:hypothetical protein [Bryobacteraceae bacterium]